MIILERREFKKKKPSTHSHTVGNPPVWHGLLIYVSHIYMLIYVANICLLLIYINNGLLTGLLKLRFYFLFSKLTWKREF